MLQHSKSPELDRFGTVGVTIESDVCRLGLSWIEKKSDPPYVVYLQEGQTRFHNILVN